VKDIVATPRSPKAIGAYSRAVKANGFVFVSGQLPIDPASGLLVKGDVAEPTRIVLENLRAILEGASSSLARLVKTTVYLRDVNDFGVVNQIYGSMFSSAPPARAPSK